MKNQNETPPFRAGGTRVAGYVVRYCAFALVAVLLLALLGELFRDKGSPLDHYAELPENTVDAIFVGSSHVYCGYCPALLWKEYGVSAYNVYAWSQPIWTAYAYTREALRTQSPEVVFLDVSSVCYGAGGADTSDIDRTNLENNLGFRAGAARAALLWESRIVGGEQLPVGEWCDLARFHTKWKYPESLFQEPDRTTAFLRNFGGLFTELDYEIFNYSFYTDLLSPSPRIVRYLEKFTELARKEGFRLVFVLTPYTANEQHNAVLNWLHEYARAQGIDFLDFMRDAGQECGFDYRADMADGDHVNVSGAFKLTRYCGEYLAGQGIRERRNNQGTVEADRDAAATLRMIEYTLLFEDCTAQDLSKWLRDNEGYRAALYRPENMVGGQEVSLKEGPLVRAVALPDGEQAAVVDFPDGERTIRREGETLIVSDAQEELWRGSAGDTVLLIYDDALGRLAYIVSIDASGSVSATGFSKLLEGAGQ